MPENAAAGTSTIPDVELASVGDWAASQGKGRLTREDLEAMLSAAADGDVDAAPVRIGHTDPRFDGEPALGWVQPTRIVETRQDGKRIPTLVGDLVGMPSKLAAVAPTAWRRRSIGVSWDLRTAAGKTYRAALDHLALLGIAAPAVKGLADVLALYADGTARAAIMREAGITTGGTSTASSASVIEFVDGLEDTPAAVAMLAAARTAGATVEQLDAMAAAAGARDTATVPQPTPDAPDDDSNRRRRLANRGEPMPRTRTLSDEELRELIGREADVDVEATIARIQATDTPPEPGQEPQTPPAPSEPGQEPQEPGQEPQEPSEPSSSTPELATLSASTLSQLRADAEAGRTALAQLDAQRRDGIIRTALTEGRLTPAERQEWRKALDRDEQTTTTLLSSLAPGRVPVTELGADHAPDAHVGPSEEQWDDFERSIGATRPQ